MIIKGITDAGQVKTHNIEFLCDSNIIHIITMHKNK
jgi:hypothetical protein